MLGTDPLSELQYALTKESFIQNHYFIANAHVSLGKPNYLDISESICIDLTVVLTPLKMQCPIVHTY